MRHRFLGMAVLVCLLGLAAYAEQQSLFPLIPSADEVTVPPSLQAVGDTLAPLLRKVSVIVGGIFGIYVILILVRIYYEHKVLRALLDIRNDLNKLNHHLHVPYSHLRRSMLFQAYQFLKSIFHQGKRRKHS